MVGRMVIAAAALALAASQAGAQSLRAMPQAPRLGLSGALRAPAGPAPALPYAATPALKRQVLSEFIERVRAKDPAAAEQAAEQFARHDYARIYQGIVAPFGLSANDAGDAVAAYTVLGWLIATGAPDPRPAAVRAARAQVAAQLAAEPRVGAPGVRAALGEEFKILFVTLHAGWQSARREGNLRQYADGVQRMFQQQSGLDLRSLELTAGGFQAAG